MIPAAADPDDELFLDELFELAIRSRSAGMPLDLESWLAGRERLRGRAVEVVSLARAVVISEPPRANSVSSLHFPGLILKEEIGRGGNGIVYRAEQVNLGRIVALKVLAPALAVSAKARQRFLREARALGRVRHPQIVAIYEVFAQQEVCAYAMEWIEGPTLAQIIASRGAPLDVAQVAQIGVQIARALDAVHAAGLVHRDVKPSNILLRADGTPVLGDFGLARDEEQSTYTSSGEFLGTAAYAAPEQLRGEQDAIGPRSDLYSLAVALYVALAGVTPFGRTPSSGEVLRRIESGRKESISKRNPRVPRDLETILAKAMDPDPARRYASAGELADDLERLLRLEPIRARPAGLLLRLQRWMERSPQLALALLALVVTLAAGTAIALSLAFDLARQSAILRKSVTTESALRIEAEKRGEYARTQASVQASLAAFLTSMFQSGNSSYFGGKADRTVRDAVLIASRELRKDESHYQPNALFKIHADLIEFLLPMGLHAEVGEHVARLALLRDALHTEGSSEYANADYFCGRTLRMQGRFLEAKCLLERSVRARRAAGDSLRIQLAQALVTLGHTQRNLGEFDAALASFGEAIVHYATDHELHFDSISIALGACSAVEAERGDFDAAHSLALASLSMLSPRLQDALHQDLGIALYHLGYARYRRGAEEEGLSLIQDAIAIGEATAGTSHRQVAGHALRLAALLLEAGQRDEATYWIDRAFACGDVLDLSSAVQLAEALVLLGNSERAVRVLAPWSDLGEATPFCSRIEQVRASASARR